MNNISNRVAELEKELGEANARIAELEHERDLLEARLDELRRVANLHLQVPYVPPIITNPPVAPVTPQPWIPNQPIVTWETRPNFPPGTVMCNGEPKAGLENVFGTDVDDMNDQPVLDAGLGG